MLERIKDALTREADKFHSQSHLLNIVCEEVKFKHQCIYILVVEH